MKRILMILLATALLCVGPLEAKRIGDFNGDGSINIFDLLEFLGYLSGKKDVPEMGHEIGDIIYDTTYVIDTAYVEKHYDESAFIGDWEGTSFNIRPESIFWGTVYKGSAPLILSFTATRFIFDLKFTSSDTTCIYSSKGYWWRNGPVLLLQEDYTLRKKGSLTAIDRNGTFYYELLPTFTDQDNTLTLYTGSGNWFGDSLLEKN